MWIDHLFYSLCLLIKRIFKFDKLGLSFISFMIIAFGYLTNLCLPPAWRFPNTYSFKSFMVLAFMYSYSSTSNLFLCCYKIGVWDCFLHISSKFFQNHLLKIYSFLNCFVALSKSKYMTVEMWIYLWVISSVPFMYLSILWQCHLVLITEALEASFEIRWCKFSTLFLFCRITL